MAKTSAFDKQAAAYDEWFERNPLAYAAELAAIRQILPAPLGKGLEVGVGSGKFAGPLGIGTGLEPSQTMAARAKAQGIVVYGGVAEHLPFSSGAFDLVLMVTVICFLDDVARAFRETYRVLKPNGSFIVGFVDSESELGRQYVAKQNESRFYREASFFSVRQVQELLKEAGFRIAESRQTLVSGDEQYRVLEGCGEGAFVAIKSVKSID